MLLPKNSFAPNNKIKGLFAERKPYCQNESLSNRFVMHPPREVGAFSLFGFSVEIYPGKGDEGGQPELFIFPGAFAVLH